MSEKTAEPHDPHLIAIITGFITGTQLSANRIIHFLVLNTRDFISAEASVILNDPTAYAFLGFVMYPPRAI